MTEPCVLVERHGPATWLRLNRPSALNALTPAVLDGLDRGLDAAAADPAVRAVVVAGQGRAFCAGADLTHVADGDGAAALERFLARVGGVFDRIEAFAKPVVAAVHGLVLAGGLELVLCCDLVVASRSAAFGDAHANHGLLPGAGSSIRLPRRVGTSRAKHLMFTGATLPAADLAGTDLLTAVVPDDRLRDEVDALVAAIAAKSPLGIAAMKALVDDGAEVPRPVGLRMERRAAAAHSRTHDFREGVTAFAQRRSPVFTGR